MFESVTNFFGGVKSFFVEKYHTASTFVHNVYDKVTNTGSNIIGTIHSDVKAVISGGGQIIEKVVDGTQKVVNNVVDGAQKVITNGQNKIGDTVSSLGSSFALPLMIGAGLFGFLMINKK